MRNEESLKYDAGIMGTDITENPMLENARIVLKGNPAPAIKIPNRKDFEKYCLDLIGSSAMEEVHAIAVDAQCRILAEAMISRGDLSSVSAPPRSIATFALLSNAHSIFMTHNHPGGTCVPSMDDIKSTTEIRRALGLFGIHLLDHMIVTPEGRAYSMAQHGDLI